MNKPLPKHEIVAELFNGRILEITCDSPDMQAWVAETAPEFGRHATYAYSDTRTSLHVDMTYDAHEVGRYLAAAGLFIDSVFTSEGKS